MVVFEGIYFLFHHPILSPCEEWQTKGQKKELSQCSPFLPHSIPIALPVSTDDKMLSCLPTGAQWATLSPLTESKQLFQYQVSLHTINTQPDLVGQQDHDTCTYSSTGTHALPKTHPALQGRSARALTSQEVLHSSGGVSWDQARLRCTMMSIALYSAFESLKERSQDGSVSAAHPAVPALSRPAWVMSTIWHSKYALSANVIHSLIKPLQKEDIFSATCCELSAQTCLHAAVAAVTASSLQKRQEGTVGRENWLLLE